MPVFAFGISPCPLPVRYAAFFIPRIALLSIGLFFVSVIGAKIGFKKIPLPKHQYITGIIRNGAMRVTLTVAAVGAILSLLIIIAVPEPCYSYYMF